MWSHDHEIWLWNEIRIGNERVLYQLYMFSYDGLLRYGLHREVDRTAVMECINETFTDLWTRRDRLPEVTHVSGYLFIMFKRKLSHRVAQKQTVYAVSDERFQTLALGDSSYEDLLIAFQTEEERKTRIRHALLKLTPRQKELIRLRYYEGLSVEEISERVHISLRTIYNTIHSAMNILRTVLGKSV